MLSGSVVSKSLTPYDLPGFLRPWDSPEKIAGVGCHALLQGIFPTQGSSQPRYWTQVSCIVDVFFLSEPPGKPKNTGVGSQSLLQGIFLTQESNLGLQHCRWTLYQLSSWATREAQKGNFIIAYFHILVKLVTCYQNKQQWALSAWILEGSVSMWCHHWLSDQIRSVAQSCPTPCDPMNRSTPGLPVHHQPREFTETHAHRVSDTIQLSHPLSSPSPPAPNPSQHQSLFQWVNSSHEVAKVLEFQL